MKKAFALILAIFVIVTFSILGAVVVSMLSSGSLGALADVRAYQALHVAEAGIRHTIVSVLLNDGDWSNNIGFTKTLSPGYYTISYASQGINSIVLISKANVSGVSRTVQVNTLRSSVPGAFGYGLYAGNQGGGPLVIRNTAVIDGNFYYNGDVTMQNSARLINGKMVSRSLVLRNSATCASWEALPVPPVAPPSFEATYYDNLLLGTEHGAAEPLNLSGSDVLNLVEGVPRYYTSITISDNARVNGPGTLVATTGNFTIQNSAILGNNIRVIAKGAATFSNSVQIGNTVEVIAQGSVTIQNGQDFPYNDRIFSYGDILFNNSSYFYGSILAPSGSVTSVNSTKFRGILYGDSIDLQNSTDLRGSVVVNSVGYFSNSATVTYDTSVFPPDWPPGLSGIGAGSITLSLWQEVY